ncbi:hypothetical protein [Halococcus qingdaonensis]|uniref:hypothetical protein n=1 Tax=Halococcus qingdaonensis TaxID=224402 RepID=UPI002116025D|nr:hypothetical protein [Halococcus qingdaonensis]
MSDSGPDDDDGRLRSWLLLTANRAVVAALLTGGLFVVLVAVGAVNTIPLRTLIRQGTHVERLFQSFVMSLVTGITLVVTLNQLVLSRELGPLGEQRDRMAGAVDFRQDIESFTGSVAPADPASFMRTFMQLSEDRASSLEAAVADNEDDAVRESVTDLTERMGEHAATIGDRLSDADFGDFDVIGTVLNYDYSWNIYATRRVRSAYADSLDETEHEAFEELLDVLFLFGPAREHFKTLYFRRELVDLSRDILYTGVPALAVSIAGLLYLNPNSVIGSTLGIENVVFVVSAAAAVASAPFFVLVAYIVRLGTIAQRTLAIGPFVLRDSQRSLDLEMEDDR